jgi:hypothetical protein
MAAGLAGPGIDTRSWVEYGTVATVGGDTGVPNFADPTAVVVDPNGVEVDVVLGTDEHPTTCRWGITAGRAFIVPPISPGDHVLVLIPNGDLGNVPEIVKILPNLDSAPFPLDDQGMPVFRNDRLLVFARGVPVDIRTDGGASLSVNPDGTVVANGGTAGVARQGDTTKLTLSEADITALAVALLATGGFTPASTPGPGTEIVFAGGEITGASASVKAGD